MKTANIPTVKLGVVAVSRDCFRLPSPQTGKTESAANWPQSGVDAYNCPTTVENEKRYGKALRK